MPTKQFNTSLKTMPQLRVIIDEQKLIKPRTTDVSNAIKTVGMALWKREQKVKGNRWQEVQYKDLPPGQVFKFTRTRFKCDDAFMNQAPSFNFELGEDQLLKKALESGFVTKVGEDKYLMNENY